MQTYKKNSLQRNKKQLFSFFSWLQFTITHLNIYAQITLLGMILWIGSLFLPWWWETQRDMTWNAYSTLSGGVGYIIIILLCIGGCILLSQNKKQKIKFSMNMIYNDHTVLLCIWICFLVLNTVATLFISWLGQYSTGVVYGSGIPLWFSAATIIIIGSIWIQKLYKKHPMGTIINESQNQTQP